VAVEHATRWFESDVPAAELVPLDGTGVTIFYDGPRFSEWTPAARVGDAVVPVFAGRFVPQPSRLR
jgi:hypothetical protein